MATKQKSKPDVLEVELDAAVSLLKEAGIKAAGKTPAKVAKMLSGLPQRLADGDEDPDLSKKSQKLFDMISEALDEDAKIVVASGDEEEEDDDDEAEGKQRRRKQKVNAKASANGKAAGKGKKGAKAKGKVKRSGGGGPSTKDQVFLRWLKNPNEDVAKVIKSFPDVQETTIRSWRSAWRNQREDGWPRAAAGKEKDIKAALKRLKD